MKKQKSRSRATPCLLAENRAWRPAREFQKRLGPFSCKMGWAAAVPGSRSVYLSVGRLARAIRWIVLVLDSRSRLSASTSIRGRSSSSAPAGQRLLLMKLAARECAPQFAADRVARRRQIDGSGAALAQRSSARRHRTRVTRRSSSRHGRGVGIDVRGFTGPGHVFRPLLRAKCT